MSHPLFNISRSFIAYREVGVSRTDYGYGADTYHNSGSVLLDSSNPPKLFLTDFVAFV